MAAHAPEANRLSVDDSEVGSGVASPRQDDPDAVVDVDEKSRPGPGHDDGNTPDYPRGLKLILIISALCLAVFLVALDQTIIAPALGAITAQFQSVKDIVRPSPPAHMRIGEH